MLNFLYPPKCVFCGELSHLPICSACHKETEYLKNTCTICNTPLHEPCTGCPKGSIYFDKNISLFDYQDVSWLMYRLKYGKNPWIAVSCGELIGAFLADQYKNLISTIDYIIDTPIHKTRLKQRGFNQAEVIAKAVAKTTNLNFIKNALTRTKQTEAQAGIYYFKRSANVEGAFNLNIDLSNKTILIIDDIYTTGATINSMAKTLKNNGAVKVYSSTFALAYKKTTY